MNLTVVAQIECRLAPSYVAFWNAPNMHDGMD